MKGATSVRLRSVCDACSRSKVKCSGTVPCERCARRKIDCHYRPMQKYRKGEQQDDQAGDEHEATEEPRPSRETTGACLATHERRTWTAFFKLYKANAHGCAAYFFHLKRRFLTLGP